MSLPDSGTAASGDDSRSLQLARPFLGRSVELVIDRPYGSRHPRHGFEYPANYGYVPGVIAPDGDELDAYFLGPNEPLSRAAGEVIAIIHRTTDDDDKLVVVPAGAQLDDDTIDAAVAFQELPGAYRIVRA